MLRKVECAASDGHGGRVTDTFSGPEALPTGLAREQNRVLAVHKLLHVPIEVGVVAFYYRDLLNVGVCAVLRSSWLVLDAFRLAHSARGWTRRSSTLNADLFHEEDASVRNIHWGDARVLLATLHGDEAVVSWSSSHDMLGFGAEFPSVDGGGQWMTLRCVPHISQALEDTDNARLRVSDARLDLFQRCLAVFMRRSIRASEVGYPFNISGGGQRLLVPGLSGLVVDLMEEK